jgi:EAL domain-containing protein (putative c-di-GMP-specific phosphodiesterase class I)
VIVIDRRQLLKLSPLNHPLEPYSPFIERLVQFLGECKTGSPDEILAAVRWALAVDGVTLFRRRMDQWELTAQHYLSEGKHQDGNADLLAQVPQVPVYSLRTHDPHGEIHDYVEDGDRKFAAFVPLSFQQNHALLVIGGLPADSVWLSDVCGQILMSLYVATCGFTTLNVAMVEAAILDDLRRTYGFVPSSLYHRRFELFGDRLTQMQIHFEPVLRLDPDYPYIDSWEALARDPHHDCAPVDLFEAAEMWGDRFMVHLDASLMRQAVSRYRDACQFPSGRRQEDVRELSVNVYPPSLMADEYFEAIRQAIQDKLIQPEKLILEISEKLPLPVRNMQTSSIEVFKKQLGRYVRDLKVGFSIDDFGAGHASVARLAGLNPSHVKIDRDLLYQERVPTEITLRFVLDLASSTLLRAPKVVVEGFDNSSPITLGMLYRLGIRYVQGHIIGKASPELHRLGKERTRYLQQLIQDDTLS